MPMINNSVTYTEASSQIIKQKLSDENFKHSNWGDDDLEPVRVEIRNHYRIVQRLICAYCLQQISIRSASGAPIEHIAPKSIYPQFIFEPKNLCIICPDCNEFKRNREVMVDRAITTNPKIRYPSNGTQFRIVHPHFDDYGIHILKRNRLYVELSEKGGYTIFVCNLNRFYRVFGQCEELVEDLALITELDQFHDGNGQH